MCPPKAGVTPGGTPSPSPLLVIMPAPQGPLAPWEMRSDQGTARPCDVSCAPVASQRAVRGLLLLGLGEEGAVWGQLPCCHQAGAGGGGMDPPRSGVWGPSGPLLPTSEDTLGCSPQALVPLGLGPAPPAQAAALPALEVGLREEPQPPPGATHTHQARHSSWHWGRSSQHTLQGPESPQLPLTPRERGEGGTALLESALPWKFYYITLLRDPVSRYLSEWRHVQRGATWKTSLHMCDGRTPTPEELPPCYEGTDWSGCTLQEFMDCPYNLASNRQVRMLADLSLVGCYNLSFIPEGKRAQLLLDSAKKNLRGMAFFGLTEFQRKTQYLFERTFNLKFIRPFMQYNSTRAGGVEVGEDTIRRIEELNDLDVQLYDYARDLFQQRYQYRRQLERRQQRLRSREERLLHRAKEAPPRGDAEEPGRVPTEDYMSHIIEKCFLRWPLHLAVQGQRSQQAPESGHIMLRSHTVSSVSSLHLEGGPGSGQHPGRGASDSTSWQCPSATWVSRPALPAQDACFEVKMNVSR
ncbi:heparan-sulfate 6-O-sulfotransferase 1 isoform X3 [Pseudorca crassidens]|uniref:heparan-sulfate 6-O-sulfotransferase 1 isoform X3 n=1 Tax=Pseudorca crassidens TaxID=82174 RepID=UPI00352C8BEB